MPDLHEVKETIGRQAETALDQLYEYFEWSELPPRVKEIVSDLIMAHIFQHTDPDKWKDASFVAKMREIIPGYEEATSASIFLDEVNEHTTRMADHLTWMAAEIDGAHKRKAGCLENCPIFRHMGQVDTDSPCLN
jgi:hypothetical protein